MRKLPPDKLAALHLSYDVDGHLIAEEPPMFAGERACLETWEPVRQARLVRQLAEERYDRCPCVACDQERVQARTMSL